VILFAAALGGAIAGSFLNALLFRYGTGHSVLKGRSRCLRCGHTLAAADLVPILSYLWLEGRCRYCHTRISAQYPLVECAAAALGALVAAQSATPLEFGLWFIAWMTLLFVFVYDMRHHVIPWECSGVLAVLGILSLSGHGLEILSVAAGPLVAAPLLALSLVSGGRLMGWGDGAMMVGVGWLLGLHMGYSALLLAFWSGAAVGIVLLLARKGYTIKSELPFAPFLIVGAGAAHFLHVDIFATLSLLFS
jgi:leader peptidase (prepilin peptidase)/N-methyltransferase